IRVVGDKPLHYAWRLRERREGTRIGVEAAAGHFSGEREFSASFSASPEDSQPTTAHGPRTPPALASTAAREVTASGARDLQLAHEPDAQHDCKPVMYATRSREGQRSGDLRVADLSGQGGLQQPGPRDFLAAHRECLPCTHGVTFSRSS